MSILYDLKRLKPVQLIEEASTSAKHRVMCDNGLLSISDEVFQIALWRGGYNMEWMDTPPEQRDAILKQLEKL